MNYYSMLPTATYAITVLAPAIIIITSSSGSSSSSSMIIMFM